MATKIKIDVRLTYHYIDRYSHLDKWGESFEVKVLAPKRLSEGNGYDCGPVDRFRVIGPKRVNQITLRDAIRTEFSYSGCTHEHDCCGCAHVSASVRRVKPGVFVVTTTTGYNY